MLTSFISEMNILNYRENQEIGSHQLKLHYFPSESFNLQKILSCPYSTLVYFGPLASEEYLVTIEHQRRAQVKVVF